MTSNRRIRRFALLLALAALPLGVAACGSSGSSGSGAPPEPSPGPEPTPSAGSACAAAAASALRACAGDLGLATLACYRDTGAPCAESDPAVADALAAVVRSVEGACADGDVVRAAGFAEAVTPGTLADRLRNACRADVASLAARTFGGPHGAALAAAEGGDRTCLLGAYLDARGMMESVAERRDGCLADERSGESCDVAATDSDVAEHAARAASSVAETCPDLAGLIAVDPQTYVERALAQVDCLTATSNGSTAPLALSCGPRPEVEDVPRGEYVQIVLDEETWGSRCGNGSPYAFWVRLAPEGAPVENVVVGMQGGGVCVFEGDCASRPEGLFQALDDDPPATGTMSNDPAVSPFADYTKIYLPYCTQDVFVGGGATSNFDSITVHRFGAVNTRAAMRWLRDAIWRELDRTTAEGYSPQRMRVYFGGFSAGAFGTLYNYHWVLDDLQWAHTVAYPDGGLALDSGEALSVAALGAILISGDAPLGWGSLPYLPPYCIETDCGLGPKLLARSSPRLLAVPEQRFMILSNQNDATQVATTFFPSTPAWINEMRRSYCETRDLPGVHYYLPPIPENVHVISPKPQLYSGLTVDGQEMRDWLAQAMADPEAVRSRVEEGPMVEAIDGVEPFPCEVAP